MITITADAQDFLNQQLAKSPAGTLGVRLSLQNYGCSGFRYVVDFTNEKQTEDHVFAFGNVQIFVDGKFMKALHGTEIDYVKQGVSNYAPEGVHSLLQFNNPNVVNACGCGESFKFKEDPQ